MKRGKKAPSLETCKERPDRRVTGTNNTITITRFKLKFKKQMIFQTVLRMSLKDLKTNFQGSTHLKIEVTS